MRTKRKLPQFVTIGNKRAVVLEESEYHRLITQAGEWEPPLPRANAEGNYPARDYLRVSIARTILRRRRALGLSQAELARRAGVRPETLNRVEHGKHAPSISTIDKIDRALTAAEAETNGGPKRKQRKSSSPS